MPLEFALRQRINLDRPARRRRRLDWLRLPPLALRVGAYWLVLGGVFWAFRSAGTADAAASMVGAEPAQMLSTGSGSEVAVAPELEAAPVTAPGPVAASATSTPAWALPPAPLPTDDPKPEPPQQTATVEEPFDKPAPRQATASHSEPARQTLAIDELLAIAPPEATRDRSSPEPTRDSTPEAPPRSIAENSSLPSCESAAAAGNETMDFGSTRGRGAPDLTRDAFAKVLENGAYLSRCAIPASAAVEVCAAVRDGKVVGVTVQTEPRNPATNACVRRAVAGLRFPHSARLDVTRTRFAPASP